MIKIKIINKIITAFINWYLRKADITFVTKTEIHTLKLDIERFKREYKLGLQEINRLKEEIASVNRDKEHYRNKYLNSTGNAFSELTFYAKYLGLVKEHNTLVERINKLGGAQFLNLAESGKLQEASVPFSSDDISELIKLCHPDKHNGSSRSTAITQKLLALRKK